jgi:putative ABC transport system permease protein
MNPLATIRIALDALLVNKGRSVLTSLGIVIGIMAVIAMVAAGNGAKEALDERLDSVGKNMIFVRPGGKTTTWNVATQVKPLGNDDAKAIRDDAELKQMLNGVGEAQFLPTIAEAGGKNYPTSITGGTTEVFTIRSWRMQAGRFFTKGENDRAARVCILGETVAKKLFPNDKNIVGKRVRIQNQTFDIIGVLEPKGRIPTGQDQDDQIFMPLETLQQKVAHEKRIMAISMAARSHEFIEPIVQRVKTVLRQRHGLKPDEQLDCEVSSVKEMSELAVTVLGILNVLIVIIASVSLVVGGIGIMNIMLVSVTERTREIGIRMAVGATPSAIRNQFLIEAVILSMIGGAIGISLGLAAAYGLGSLVNWPIYITSILDWIAMAFGVAAAVGVFFGYYPAAKASRLDPIEALRYE